MTTPDRRWTRGHRCWPALAALTLMACATPQSAVPPAATLDVVELSATEARDRMAAGRLTSADLTRAYLDRIAAIPGPLKEQSVFEVTTLRAVWMEPRGKV